MGAASLTNIPSRLISMPVFRTMAREAYPRTVEEMLQWASEMWNHCGIYSKAIRTAVRYFMTEVEIRSDKLGVLERQTYAKTVEDNFDILGEVSQIGDDYMGWGTSITTHHYPFTRNLRCPKENCSMDRSIKHVRESSGYTWVNGKFTGTCPDCGSRVEFIVKDLVRVDDAARCFITRWPQQVCEIAYNHITGSRDVTVDIPKYTEITDPILRGDPIYIDETPMEILECAVRGHKLKLQRDRVFVLTTDVPAFEGPMMSGWGKAPFMNAFDDVFMLRLLDRFNEAIVSERIMPFHVLSPPPIQGGVHTEAMADMIMSHSTMNYPAELQRLIARHRKNPTGFKTFPFPLQSQIIGGDAKQLLTVDLQEYIEGRVLREIGIPAEFYNPSADAAPVINYQIFEKSFQHFSNRLNKWISWLFQQQAKFRKWKDVDARLVPVQLKSDPAVMQITVDQVAANRWPGSMLDRMMGRNPVEVFKEKLEEEVWQSELLEAHSERMQKRMDNKAAITPMTGAQAVLSQQQGGQMPPGGAPMPPSGAPMPMAPGGGMPPVQGQGMGSTVEGLMEQAAQSAQQIYVMDSITKRRELQRIKATDQTMYNQIKGIMSQMETDAEAQGRVMSRQPQQGAMM